MTPKKPRKPKIVLPVRSSVPPEDYGQIIDAEGTTLCMSPYSGPVATKREIAFWEPRAAELVQLMNSVPVLVTALQTALYWAQADPVVWPQSSPERQQGLAHASAVLSEHLSPSAAAAAPTVKLEVSLEEKSLLVRLLDYAASNLDSDLEDRVDENERPDLEKMAKLGWRLSETLSPTNPKEN